jgi:histidyl-tRNA synthetase
MSIKTPQGSVVDVPRGMRDFDPRESIHLKEVLAVVEEIFKRHGFAPLITPSLENTEVLNAKAYGEESGKEMYFMEGKETALRFDFTVPLARFMAMNKDIPLPFKRYQIGSAWRRDEPQKLRYREFTQADIDIIGSSDIVSDAECIATTMDALAALGVRNCLILVNSRPLLDLVLGHFKIPADKRANVMKILDKMPKIGAPEAINQLKAAGMQDNDAQVMLSFINERMPNDDKLKKLEVNVENSKPETERLRSLISALHKFGVKDEVSIDLSLARGLDYYTGLVWEVIIQTTEGKLPSIASGGRYDRLIGSYSKSSFPAVGSSIGISRIFELLSKEDGPRTYANVFIAQVGAENLDYSISVANKLRDAGIYADLNVTDKGISKQLEYSNSLGIRFVAIAGSKEREAGKIKIKDMQTGTEELLDIDAAISQLKK